ncbi:MAG: putative Ig domain-containing protein [Chloroflexota bacterium]
MILASLIYADVSRAALIIIDDYEWHLGTRTVDLSNNQGLSPWPTFSQDGGIAFLRLHSSGNSGNVITFTYSDFGPYDFTDGGANQQLYFEFDRILNSDPDSILGPRVQVILQTTYGQLYSTGVGLGLYDGPVIFTYPFNHFTGNPAGFTAVTGIQISFYSHGTHQNFYNDVYIQRIRATPLGGSAPLPPTPMISLASGQAATTTDQPANFRVAFNSDITGLDSSAIQISGTAGATTAVITGGPRIFNVSVGGAPNYGTIQIAVLANSVQDNWDQWNLSTTSGPVVSYGLPPQFANSPPTTATAGTGYNFTYNMDGTPPISLSLTAGALPTGLSLSSGMISGTPTHSGIFNGTVEATSDFGSATQDFSITVDCPVVTVIPESLSAGTAAQAYSQTLSAQGLDTLPGDYTYAVTAGLLPAGLTLTGNNLSGTPTASGTFSFTISASKASTNCAGSRAYTLNIAPPNITVSPATLADGRAGDTYTQAITAAGGNAPYSYSITSGALPAGLTLNNGTISGTPAVSGSFGFTVQVADSTTPAGSTSEIYTLNIAPPTLAISPATLPAATAAQAYSQVLSASGGNAPYTFAISAGALPAGLTLNGSTIEGTPTVSGSFTFTVQVTDSTTPIGSDERVYTLDIAPPILSLNPTALPSGTAAQAYSASFSAADGNAPYTYEITSGALPAGLTLDNGTISGTPVGRGTFTFTVQATDSTTPSATTTRSYELTIASPAITITPDTIPTGESGVAYAGATFAASGGVEPYSFNLVGALPSGLTFDPATASISGTPMQSGSFPITVQATDSTSPAYTQSRDYTLVIDSPVLTFLTDSLPSGEAGAIYGGVTFSVVGGVSPYTYSIVSGSLPNGLTLSGNTITGTPTQSGSFPITVQVSDSTSPNGTQQRTYTLIIAAPTLTLLPDAVPAGESGTEYPAVSFLAVGGVSPYTYSIVAGSLPSGLTFSADTITGTPLQSGSFPVTVQVSDSTDPSVTAQRDYIVVIAPPTLSMTPSTLPNGTVGFEYNQSLSASGGITPYSFVVSAGILPDGLTLSSDGVLSGTPTSASSFDFTVQVSDSTEPTATAEQVYSVQIDLPALTVQPDVLPEGISGQRYETIISATGGVGPYTFALTGGSLPTGLALEANGTLTGTTLERGDFAISVTTTDTVTGATAQRDYTLTFNLPVLGLTPTALPDARVHEPYIQTITAANGTAPYIYTLSAGAIPDGFTFNAGTGLFSGQTHVPGSYTFTITATDQTGATAERHYTLIIAETPADLMPPPVETCQAQNEHPQGMVRSTLPMHEDAVYCRLLVTNGNYQTWQGRPATHAGMIGHQGVLDLGVIHAIDVFSPSGATRFDAEAVCLRGSGHMLFMAASQSPRIPVEMPTWQTEYWPGFTCVTLWEPGSVILVARAPVHP